MKSVNTMAANGQSPTTASREAQSQWNPAKPTRKRNTAPKHASQPAASSTKISTCQTQSCAWDNASANEVFEADRGTRRRRSKE